MGAPLYGKITAFSNDRVTGRRTESGRTADTALQYEANSNRMTRVSITQLPDGSGSLILARGTGQAVVLAWSAEPGALIYSITNTGPVVRSHPDAVDGVVRRLA